MDAFVIEIIIQLMYLYLAVSNVGLCFLQV